MRKPFSPSERLQVRTMPLSTGTHYTITYIRRSHGPMDTPAEISRTLVCFPITCRNTGSRCSSLAGTISRALASGENQLYPEHQSSPSSRRCITQAFIDVRWYTNRSVSISLSTSPRLWEKLEEWGRQGNRTGLSLQDAELSGGEEGQGLQQRRILLP